MYRFAAVDVLLQRIWKSDWCRCSYNPSGENLIVPIDASSAVMPTKETKGIYDLYAVNDPRDLKTWTKLDQTGPRFDQHRNIAVSKLLNLSGLAPQVGLVPTILRLTAECFPRRCL